MNTLKVSMHAMNRQSSGGSAMKTRGRWDSRMTGGCDLKDGALSSEQGEAIELDADQAASVCNEESLAHRSRLYWQPSLLVTLLFLLTAAVGGRAQNFSIDWFSIDGGGGTSAGGSFSLSGTIGQPDASARPMIGGAFSLTGGFWSLFAVQTPDAPRLSIQRLSESSVRVTWPSPSTGFVLQQLSDLNATNWVNAPQAVSDNGTNRFITVNPATGRRFYRLFKP